MSLGNSIFDEIDANEYLNELYQDILYNYSLKLFGVSKTQKVINISDALRFADLLSKSDHPTNSEMHKILAQEIVALLRPIHHPERHPDIDLIFGSVLTNGGNSPGRAKLAKDYSGINFSDKVYNLFVNDIMAVPGEEGKYFFRSQKAVYDRLTDPYLSYSGPTSMGKSFVMQAFLKEQVNNNLCLNFCIVIPSKALINEVSSEIIQGLNTKLEHYNYRVVTSAGDLILEREITPNLIFVLTPERLLYLLIKYPNIKMDYLFIDEAHKISTKESRSAFYYKVIDMFNERENKPHMIFASPNIPNPKVFLNLISGIEDIEKYQLPTKFSPVSQIKYLLNLVDGEIQIFNGLTNELKLFHRIAKNYDLITMIKRIEVSKMTDKETQTLVYFNSKDKTVEYARRYADTLDVSNPMDQARLIKAKNDPALIALAKEIKSQISPDYYLAELVTKGVAYHIGYLPRSIRTKIEELYRNGNIQILFCTSTLIEGVNLPADNLFVTTSYRGRGKMKEVDFKNLIGRVGRIKYNLFGNVFLTCTTVDNRTKFTDYVKLLQTPVPEQKLSLVSSLDDTQKKKIVNCLVQGNLEFNGITNADDYGLVRKFGLILLKDILRNRNSIVKRAFDDFISFEVANKIKERFAAQENQPDDDINTSVDQTQGIYAKIRNQRVHYPILTGDSQQDYNNIVTFLNELHIAFKWSIYEKNMPLGSVNSVRWIAVLLQQWIGSLGLGQIVSSSIFHYERNPEKFYHGHKYERYSGSAEHKNIIIGDTLETIEHTLLFSLSNYFLKFTEAYKKINGSIPADNDWYEFVEYGTTNPLTIFLQRNGFSRESALYIRAHCNEFVISVSATDWHLSRLLLNCENEGVCKESADVVLNIPDLFVD